MGVVRAIASTNRTVVCTIHQPSAPIFSAFDELVLLQRGGALVYSGDAAGIVPYLSKFPGAPPLEAGRNPASWMLELVTALGASAGEQGGGAGGGKGGAGVSLAEAYAESAQAKAAAQRAAAAAAGQLVGEGDAKTVSADDLAVFGPRPGVIRQFGELMRRNLAAYWRDPGHNISRFVITLCMAVLVGTVELGKGR
jgi:hypothetical protein